MPPPSSLGKLLPTLPFTKNPYETDMARMGHYKASEGVKPLTKPRILNNYLDAPPSSLGKPLLTLRFLGNLGHLWHCQSSFERGFKKRNP